MEKKYLILFSAVVFVLPFIVFAADSQKDSVEGVLAEITGAQKIDKVSEIDCQKINDGEFERLGDAAMGIMHPDESEHNLMDRMMGGEGSDSLKAAHIIMGKRYLGCASGIMGMGGGNMMGGGMMGNWSSPFNQNYFNSMMGNFGAFAWFGWIFMVLFWLLILLGIISMIKWLIGQTGGENKKNSSLDILKERYAKGEISKEEFEEKKERINLY